MQQYTPLDQIIIHLDQGIRTIFGNPIGTSRPNPAEDIPETQLSDNEKHLSTRLLRVDHAGEVCAQALYQGQSLTARNPDVQNTLQQSAYEENDHLHWCQIRLQELEGQTSFLNPLWYTGSFAIGATVGLLGDKYSLGFLAETERQVVQHLESHLERLPIQDQKSHAILEQMKSDEGHHATVAMKSGGVQLPKPVCWLMNKTSKIMTNTAFWI